MNPAAQGSSLTEGKRNKRSKKNGGENGEGGRSSSPEDNNSELIVEAPEKLAEDVSYKIFKIKHINIHMYISGVFIHILYNMLSFLFLHA